MVDAADGAERRPTVPSGRYFRLNVTHSSMQTTFAELRIGAAMDVAAVKRKLYTHCGTEPIHQHLALVDADGALVAELSDDNAVMAQMDPADGWTIHVTDLDPSSLHANGGLDDVRQVDKVTLSEGAAAERAAEFQRFKQARGAGRPPSDEHLADVASALADRLGSTCEVSGRRGVLRYVGKIPEIAQGHWVGVQYDEAVGKNDGAVKGVRYFSCPDNAGGFVRPDKVVLPAASGVGR